MINANLWTTLAAAIGIGTAPTNAKQEPEESFTGTLIIGDYSTFETTDGRVFVLKLATPEAESDSRTAIEESGGLSGPYGTYNCFKLTVIAVRSTETDYTGRPYLLAQRIPKIERISCEVTK